MLFSLLVIIYVTFMALGFPDSALGSSFPAIAENLARLGVPVQEEEDGVLIAPAQPKDAVLPSFGDHRVAMAFSLIGLKTGGIAIEDPLCCAKTFPDYFSILDRITAEGH